MMAKSKKRSVMGRQAIYPWEKWLSYKNSFTLKKGQHYTCTTQSMALQFRSRANRAGIIVHIHQYDTELVIKLEHSTKEGK